jgi:5-methylcytosine-specific restriction endonuclease McrA
MNRAKRKYEGENKRQKFAYECGPCKGLFKAKDVQVDHIQPAGSLLSRQDLPQFVERLYCGEDGLQVLCKQCHQIKTNKERKSEQL